ncbi:M3 family metallopeptidase [Streptococcus sp. H49]|uniref:M3 family metallopeptidase n=1 Tax=Streptococcus huangxiaojuni TaxID=3237239 RepID=UPI0034A5125F
MTTDKFSWDLTDIYINDNAFLSDLKTCHSNIEEFIIKFNPEFSEDNNVIYILSEIENIYVHLNKLYSYAFLNLSKNSRGEKEQKNFQSISNIYDRFDIEVIKIQHSIENYFRNNIDKLKKIKSEGKFLFYLNNLYSENNSLIYEKFSPKTEYQKLIYSENSRGHIIYNDRIINLNYTNQLEYLTDDSAELRNMTYNFFLEYYRSISLPIYYLYKLTLLNYNIQSQNKGYSNYYEMYGNTILGNYMSVIIKRISYLTKIINKIFVQQKTITNLDMISYADLYYIENYSDISIKISEAIDIVYNVFCSIDEKWGKLFLKIVDEKWIDWLPSIGKRQGGFSINVYTVHPYILINWDGHLDGIYALGHEAIGAILNYSSKHNEFSQSSHSILITELFSQYIEFEITKYLKKTRKDLKNYLVKRELIDFKDKVLMTLINSLFEMKCFSKSSEGEISLGKINEYYYEATEKIFGNSELFDNKIKNKYNWVAQGHIFTPFYDSSYTVVYFLAKYFSKKKYLTDRFLEIAKLGSKFSDDYIFSNYFNISVQEFESIFMEVISEFKYKGE